MNLMQVKPGSTFLVWPDNFAETNKFRGGPGFIVDLDAPCERRWCEGQLHKLIPAPAGKLPNPIDHPAAVREQRDERKRLEQEATQAAADAAARAASAAKGEDAESELREDVGPKRQRKAGRSVRLFEVHSHRQLCGRHGDLVASGGERVAADHPAVLALSDPHGVGRFVDVEQPEPAPLEPATSIQTEPSTTEELTFPHQRRGRRFGVDSSD